MSTTQTCHYHQQYRSFVNRLYFHTFLPGTTEPTPVNKDLINQQNSKSWGSSDDYKYLHLAFLNIYMYVYKHLLFLIFLSLFQNTFLYINCRIPLANNKTFLQLRVTDWVFFLERIWPLCIPIHLDW